jgi:hypothetical protein
MPLQDTTDNARIIGRTTILILCGLLFWLSFASDAGSASAKVAMFGGVAGVVGYLGLLFSGRQTATQDRVAS